MAHTASQALELEQFRTRGEDHAEIDGQEGDGPHEVQSLPRADGGREAWLFLCSCFMLEALTWGFPFAFGVFEKYYSTIFDDASGIAAIGTTATGIMYISSPLIHMVLSSWPQYRPIVMYGGLALNAISLIAASFATQIWHLIMTQGVLFAIGGLMLYFPGIIYLDEWFIRRKGLAYGIMWGGTGTAGIIIPLFMDWMLNTWGFRTTLRAWAIIIVVLIIPSSIYCRPRLPVSNTTRGFRRVDLGFLKTPAFWILQAGNMAQALGFFMPTIYMPAYANIIGLSPLFGTLALSTNNASAVVGAIFVGILVDRFHISLPILVCTVGSTIAVFVFWGLAGPHFAGAVPLLFLFAVFYGIFAGGFATTWVGCSAVISRQCRGVETGMVIATFAAGKGVGALVSGPLSELLVKEGAAWKGRVAGAYGSGYGAVVVFSGCTALLGGASLIGKRMGWV